MTRRTDSSGRVLKTGENQRKDGIYQYRYTDDIGVRRTIYAGTLKQLREKEDRIAQLKALGVNYRKGNITTMQLLEKYISMKTGVKTSTANNYKMYLRIINNYPLSRMRICDVRTSDIKQFLIDVCRDRGSRNASVNACKSILNAAFNMACDDDALLRNPAQFKLSDIVHAEPAGRKALSVAQQKSLLEFLKTHCLYHKYYSEFVILLGTGLRVSEFCGLTIPDVDFTNGYVSISRQLLKESSGRIYLETPKSRQGVRRIPMTPAVAEAFSRSITNRHPVKPGFSIDGRNDFIFISNHGIPKSATTLASIFKKIFNAYNSAKPEIPIEQLTPHILRHTFCTNLIASGMDIKSVQYLMGHATSKMTMDVYAHGDYERAAAQMPEI